MRHANALPPSATALVLPSVAYLDADVCSVPLEVDDACARIRAVRRKRVIGSPYNRDALRRGEGLPGYGSVLFVRAMVEYPAGYNLLLAQFAQGAVLAFDGIQHSRPPGRVKVPVRTYRPNPWHLCSFSSDIHERIGKCTHDRRHRHQAVAALEIRPNTARQVNTIFARFQHFAHEYHRRRGRQAVSSPLYRWCGMPHLSRPLVLPGRGWCLVSIHAASPLQRAIRKEHEPVR
jgi:hypothetical protein